MIYGWVVVGKAKTGSFKDDWVVVGNFKVNVLAKTKEQAEEYLDRSRKYLSSIPESELEISTLKVVPVQTIEV